MANNKRKSHLLNKNDKSRKRRKSLNPNYKSQKVPKLNFNLLPNYKETQYKTKKYLERFLKEQN